MDNFKEKVIGGFAWEGGTRLIVQVASWLSTIWVARLLVPEDYGIVAISGVFTGLGICVAGMGLGSALVNRKIYKHKHGTNVFWISLCMSVLMYGSLFLLAYPISSHFDIPGLVAVITVSSTIVIISALGVVPRALAMRRLLFKQSALIAMSANVVVIVGTLTLAHLGFAYWSLIYPVLLGELFTVTAFWILIRYRPGMPNNLLSVVPYFRYGVQVAGANIVGFATSHWPTLIIGTFFGQTATGYFQMANVLAKMPMEKIGQIFSAIAFPSFSRIQADTSRTRSVFSRFHAVLYMITVPMFLGLAVVADDLIPLLIGQKWTAIVEPLRIMCLINVFAIGSQLLSVVAISMGKPKVNLINESIMFVLTPIAMLLALPWDLMGVLLGWALVFPLAYTFLVSRVTYLIGYSLSQLLRDVGPAIVSAVLMVVSVLTVQTFLESLSLGQLVILSGQVITGVLSYSLILIIVDRARVQEVMAVIARRG